MLTSISRGATYLLLLLAFLFHAVLSYGFGGIVGAFFGGLTGVVLSLMLYLPTEQSTVPNALAVCGGLLGAGYALILLCRLWLSHARASGDANIRALAQYLDDLSRAMWPKR